MMRTSSRDKMPELVRPILESTRSLARSGEPGKGTRDARSHSGRISGVCDTIYLPIIEPFPPEGTQHDPRRCAQTAVQESLRAGDPRPGHLVGRGRRPDLPVVRAAVAGRLPAVGEALRRNG